MQKNKVSKRCACQPKRTPLRALAFALTFLVLMLYLTVDAIFSPWNDGGERVIVPDFCGGDASLAKDYEWLDVTVEYRHDETRPAGTVLSQTPAAGLGRRLTADVPHLPLTLYVSLGRAVAYLPDVVGMSAAEATARLREAGFAVFEERRESPYPEGTVYQMTPSPDEELPRGSEVRLLISAGAPQREVRVPDLRGKQRAAALAKIWLAGLRVTEVVEEASFLPAGEVLRQEPPAGSLLLAGGGVRLYVSAGLAGTHADE